MLGDHGDSHARTSCNISSQSGRNRFSPYRAQAASRAASPASRAAAGSRMNRRDRRVQLGRVGRDRPGGRRHRPGGLGGGQHHHRHGQLHGLDQRQPERRPAERVHVDPAPGQLTVHPGLGQVLELAALLRGPGAARAARPVTRMPNTSSGAAAAKPGSRSVPVVRPRRSGSLTTTAARGMLAGPAGAGIRDAVLHHVHRRPAAVPVHGVEPGHVHDREARGVRHRVPGAHRGPGRRVVLQVHGGQVPAGLPAQPGSRPAPARRAAAATTTSTGSLAQLLRRDLDDVGRPVPGPGPAEAERPAVRAAPGTRYSCRPCTNVVSPGPVQVPDEDSHPAAPATVGSPEWSERLVRRGSGRRARGDRGHHVGRARPVQARVPGDRAGPGPAARARRVLVAEQRSSGTPYGAHRAAGTTGANRLTTGVPTAAARCAAPVFGATTTSAPASTAASMRQAGPAAQVHGRPGLCAAGRQTAAVSPASAARAGHHDPVPGRGQRGRPWLPCGPPTASRAGTDALACTTT